MPAVQFFGIDAVMDAAENLKCPNWGIFIGRSMFSKYEGSDEMDSLAMLDKYLDVLKNSDSNTVYTLKFFEKDPGKQIKITEKSVCDGGSFNFKLVDPVEREQQRIGSNTNYHGRQLEDKIAALEKKLKDLDNEEEEEPETLGSIVRGLLQKPHELAQLVNIGRAALGLPVQPIEAIGAIPAIVDASVTQETDAEREIRLNRLGAAIDVLERSDPRLVEHLEKLAKMAEQTPDQFNATVSMLDLK